MMARHGSEAQYNKNLINGFKSGDDPEIIIVVDKLLTGFDTPRNTVLYLTRQLQSLYKKVSDYLADGSGLY